MRARNTFFAAAILIVALPVLAEQAILQCDFKSIDLVQPEQKIEWHRDPEKYISPYLLQHKISQNKPQLMVVDIRNVDAYQHNHIDQSFNLPHSKLLTIPFFKEREVVLVGQGQSYRHLEDLHKKLLKRGFNNVKILDGGVDYWKSVIEGESLYSKLDDLFLLNNAMGGDTGFWQIVDSSNNPHMDRYFDSVIALDGLAILQSPQSFTQQITEAKGLIKNVLLVIPDHLDAREVVKKWRTKLKANVYAVGASKVQSALQVHEHNRRIVQYQKRRTDGARMSCS